MVQTYFSTDGSRDKGLVDAQTETDTTSCRHVDDCSAPLCPLAPNLKHLIWYPGEDICRRRDGPGWIRTQKAIASVGAPEDKFFTVAMLQAITRVQKRHNRDRPRRAS
jgi:hypothetical protein